MNSAPPEPVTRPLSFVAAALWTLLAAMVVAGTVTAIDSVHPGAFTDVVTIAACRLLGYSVVFFAILRVHEPESSIREVLALRRSPFLLVLLSAVVGVALAPVASWVESVLAARFPPSPTDVEAVARLLDAPTAAKKVALVVALGVVSPACDALFFGGALFTPLKRGRRADFVVLAISAYETLFAAPSARDAASMLGALLAMAWLRAVTGSTVPALVARVAFFAVQVVPLVVGRELPLRAPIVVGAALAGAAALAAIAAVGKRSARVLDARLQDG